MMTVLCVWRLVRVINKKYHWSCCYCGDIKPLGKKHVILDASLGQVGTPLMFLPTSNLYIPFSRWWRCLRSQQRSQSWRRFRYPPQHHVSRHKEAARSRAAGMESAVSADAQLSTLAHKRLPQKQWMTMTNTGSSERPHNVTLIHGLSMANVSFSGKAVSVMDRQSCKKT